MKLLLTLYLYLQSFNLLAFPIESSVLQKGDFIFQDLNCGELCDAIEEVTTEDRSLRFSHVGIVQIIEDEPFVYEAIGRNVQKTKFLTFAKRSLDQEGHPLIAAFRLKKAKNKEIEKILVWIEEKMGSPYDIYFKLGGPAYYCSELIYLAFQNSVDYKNTFKLNAMTFKQLETGMIHPAWQKYFENLKVRMPEGELGINPNAMSKSASLEPVKLDFKGLGNDK